MQRKNRKVRIEQNAVLQIWYSRRTKDGCWKINNIHHRRAEVTQEHKKFPTMSQKQVLLEKHTLKHMFEWVEFSLSMCIFNTIWYTFLE